MGVSRLLTLLILFRKYRAKGSISAAWFKRPRIHSSSSSVACLFWMMDLMSCCQAINLSKGKETDKNLVLILHPNTEATSDKVPSSASFDSERQSSLGIGSLGDKGLQIV